MLGFSPLAGAPLGGDEDQAVVGGAFQPRNILTGAPVVATVAMSSEQDFTPVGVATAAPVLGSPAAAATTLVQPGDIITGAPVLGAPAAAAITLVQPGDIVTRAPVVAPASVAPIPVNGIVTGAPVFAGIIDTPGSIDAYARAVQAEGLAFSSSPQFQFSPDGTKYFVKPVGDGVGRPPQRYDLATPWDVATGTLVNANAFNITTTHSIQDFQLSNDGLYIAFLMWANSDGASSIHLYSLAEPFVTNYTGTSSSAGSDDGYTFVRSFIIDSGYRNVRALRHFDGKLYTVKTPTPVGSAPSQIQRRGVSNTLFSSLGVSSNATVLAETLTTTTTGYSVAFLSPDGASRIYHSNAAYDPLTLEQLEVSGQTLGGALRYQLKPDGIGIVVPQLAEIDTDTSVTIQQEGASAVVSLTAPAPILGTAAFDQSHALASGAVLTGAPEIVADLVQGHIFGAEPLLAGAPELTAAVFQDHSLPPVDLLTGAPELPATVFQDHRTGAASLTTGPPDSATTEIGQEHALDADALLSPAPALAQTDLSQNHDLVDAAPLLTGAPTLPATVFQEHQLLADALLTGAPEIDALLVCDHKLPGDDLLGTAPSLVTTEIGQDHAPLPGDILAGAPVLGQANPALVLETADLAATELPDEVTISLAAFTTADLAVTETPDTASIALIDGIFGSLEVTETPDTAAGTLAAQFEGVLDGQETPDGFAGELAARHTANLAASERLDRASGRLRATHDVTFALSEAGDTASATAEVFFAISLGASEAPDLATFSVSERHEAALASSELPDTVSVRLNTNVTLRAQSGSYGYQGFPAELFTEQRLDLRTGSYAFSGFSAQFSISRTIYPQTGYYDVTGNETDLYFLQFLDIDGEVISVSPEIREVLVPVEDRAISAGAEDRAVFVPAEDRLLVVRN